MISDDNLLSLKHEPTADVYKGGSLAGRLDRNPDGSITFRYYEMYLAAGGPAIAFTLPLSADPVTTPNGGLPPFFTGLLPEGYRLTALTQRLKTSANDELSLLLAVGADTPGDVQVVPGGQQVRTPKPAVELDLGNTPHFADLVQRPDRRAIPGVQPKISTQMITLSARLAGKTFILKLEPDGYPGPLANEHHHLLAARKLRHPVAESRLIFDDDGAPGLLVTRFDRVTSPTGERRLAMEDATQIMGVTPADKYLVSTEELINAVAAVCAGRDAAALALFTRFVFAWLIGAGDLHGKNVAVLEGADGWQLSPIYDIACTLVYQDDSMALRICGAEKNLRAAHWNSLAGEIGISPAAAKLAVRRALKATKHTDLAALNYQGSVLNGAQRELRHRRYEAEKLL